MRRWPENQGVPRGSPNALLGQCTVLWSSSSSLHPQRRPRHRHAHIHLPRISPGNVDPHLAMFAAMRIFGQRPNFVAHMAGAATLLITRNQAPAMSMITNLQAACLTTHGRCRPATWPHLHSAKKAWWMDVRKATWGSSSTQLAHKLPFTLG